MRDHSHKVPLRFNLGTNRNVLPVLIIYYEGESSLNDLERVGDSAGLFLNFHPTTRRFCPSY